MILEAIINGIFYLNFQLFIIYCSVYKNSIDFCIVTLCPATLLNSATPRNIFGRFLRIVYVQDHVVRE